MLAVVAFRGGRSWLQMRGIDAKWQASGPARLSGYGRLPTDEAARVFQENHRRCFQSASAPSPREAAFDDRRYEACLDEIAGRYWGSRVTLSGGNALEQDPYFPGSWRTYVSASGVIPGGFNLKYEDACDGQRTLGVSSNISDRNSGRMDTEYGHRAELVIPKLFARQCKGVATIKVSAMTGDWLLGPPLVVRLPRESESPGESSTTTGTPE